MDILKRSRRPLLSFLLPFPSSRNNLSTVPSPHNILVVSPLLSSVPVGCPSAASVSLSLPAASLPCPYPRPCRLSAATSVSLVRVGHPSAVLTAEANEKWQAHPFRVGDEVFLDRRLLPVGYANVTGRVLVLDLALWPPPGA